MNMAKVEPTGIAGQIRRMTFAFGPPAAKVPAQLINMAHGGRFKGGSEMITVVAASREAIISTGGRRKLINVPSSLTINFASMLRGDCNSAPFNYVQPRGAFE